jgi:AcrR family transcriptional regulator
MHVLKDLPSPERVRFDSPLTGEAGSAMSGGAMRPQAVEERETKEQDRAVREVWRDRLLEAMAEVVAERGLRGASVTAVASRASVSRSHFGELFGSLDDCFLALLEQVLGRATTLIDEAFERESCWSDGVLAGLEALLVFLDAESVSARACLVETVAGTPSALESRAHMLKRLGARVDGARQQLSMERQPPATMSEATIASVLGMLRRRLLSGEAPPFVSLLGELAEVVVAPYLGPTAAIKASRIGSARAQVRLRQRSVLPVAAGVEIPKMLCHASAHRMRACLRYLAEQPDASNRTIAVAVGISHPGQTSMLLARLYDAGLLFKKCGGAGRPNAWSLSPCGVEVTRALHLC